jgi:hypothetical protein
MGPDSPIRSGRSATIDLADSGLLEKSQGDPLLGRQPLRRGRSVPIRDHLQRLKQRSLHKRLDDDWVYIALATNRRRVAEARGDGFDDLRDVCSPLC